MYIVPFFKETVKQQTIVALLGMAGQMFVDFQIFRNNLMDYFSRGNVNDNEIKGFPYIPKLWSRIRISFAKSLSLIKTNLRKYSSQISTCSCGYWLHAKIIGQLHKYINRVAFDCRDFELLWTIWSAMGQFPERYLVQLLIKVVQIPLKAFVRSGRVMNLTQQVNSYLCFFSHISLAIG